MLMEEDKMKQIEMLFVIHFNIYFITKTGIDHNCLFEVLNNICHTINTNIQFILFMPIQRLLFILHECYTSNNNFLIKLSKFYKSDCLFYFNKNILNINVK